MHELTFGQLSSIVHQRTYTAPMEEFFRRLLKPINLLSLTLAGIAVFLSFLSQYNGLGIIAISPERKADLYQVSHFMIGLVLTIMGIRLIVEYKAKWYGFILLLMVFAGFTSFGIIPAYWERVLTGSRFQQFIDTVIWMGWILPAILTAYTTWRWYTKRHS
jgi:hypothetical protein